MGEQHRASSKMASFAKTPWDILGATCGGSKMAIVGRDPKMATNARGPQSGSTGVEEQGGAVAVCDRVIALRVLGHRAGLE